jgi:hypothetical protein
MVSACLELVKRREIFPTGNFLGSDLSEFGASFLVVFAKLNLTAMLPTEDDSLRIDDNQFARDETRILKFQLGNLALPAQCSKVRAPRDCPGRDEIVPSDFDRLHDILVLHDSDDFVKMAWVVSDPLAFQI